MTGTMSAAHGGGHECPGRPRRCSAGEYVPIAPSTSATLAWAPPRAWSSPQRLAGSNDPVSAEEPVTELRRALVDLHGSKSVSAFARDEFYIGPIYGVIGPKVRPSRRRRERRCEGAIRRAPCEKGAFVCSRPSRSPEHGTTSGRHAVVRRTSTQKARRRASHVPLPRKVGGTGARSDRG